MYHTYYQWVNLFLFLQACSFYIPRSIIITIIIIIIILIIIILRIIWRNMEGGTIKHLQQDLNNPVIDEKKRVEQEKKVVNYLTISKVRFFFH